MSSSTPTNNRLALVCLLLAKLFGIAGLCMANRIIGATMLFTAGCFIVLCIILCLKNMKATSHEETSDKEYLQKLLNEGTLHQYLKDLKAT